jgi:peptidoglycan-associated lipoprotein
MLGDSSVALQGDASTSKTSLNEERTIEDMVIAKVEPAHAARRQAEQMQLLQQEQEITIAAGLRDVLFGFDSWSLSEDAKQALSVAAEWLRANPAKAITIEGHCDERGTAAYNLVLGEKRAKAVRNYLTNLGVGDDRLLAVSYGKERPMCRNGDEACHQQNRRGHFAVRMR